MVFGTELGAYPCVWFMLKLADILTAAPEPRDIQWFNLSLSPSSVFVRKLLVVFTLLVLLSVWSIPVAFIATLLSWDSITDLAPNSAKWIAKRYFAIAG